MMLVLIAITGVAALGGIAVLAVSGGIQSVGHERFKTIALYAAESGAASGMDFLRRTSAQGIPWSSLVTPDNDAPLSPADVIGNGARPGDPGNPFGADVGAWFEVVILNNPADPGFAAGEDLDGRLIVRATGFGPDGTVAQVEWEVRNNALAGPVAHCPGYGQRGLSEAGVGRNDCLSLVDASITATYTPGEP